MATGMIGDAKPGTGRLPCIAVHGEPEEQGGQSANTSGIQIRAANADDAPAIAGTAARSLSGDLL